MYVSPNEIRPLIVTTVGYKVNWVDEDTPNTVYKNTYGPIQNNPITSTNRRQVWVHFNEPIAMRSYADDVGAIFGVGYDGYFLRRDQLVVIVSTTQGTVTPSIVNQTFNSFLFLSLCPTNWDPETLTYNNKPAAGATSDFGTGRWINSRTSDVTTPRLIPDTLHTYKFTAGASPVYGFRAVAESGFSASVDFGHINFIYVSLRKGM